MKTLFASVLLLLLFQSPLAFASQANDISGFWMIDSGDAVIRIYARQGKYYGAIAWLKDPLYNATDGDGLEGMPVVDRRNPVEALRSRPLLGLELLSGLRFDGEETWQDGSVYNSDDGEIYRCKVWLSDINTLKLRGYLGISLLGETTAWSRVMLSEAQADFSAVSGQQNAWLPTATP